MKLESFLRRVQVYINKDRILMEDCGEDVDLLTSFLVDIKMRIKSGNGTQQLHDILEHGTYKLNMLQLMNDSVK